jgi:hypothetical protein
VDKTSTSPNGLTAAYVATNFPYLRYPDAQFLMEVERDGYPTREIAITADNQVVHRFLDERFRDGQYGVFADGYGVDRSEVHPISQEPSRRPGVGSPSPRASRD